MSKMVNCKACGKEIAKGVKKCVHCGKDQRNFFMKHKILTAIGVIVILGVLSSLGGKKDSTASTVTATPTTEVKQEVKEEPKKSDTKITYENFLAVKMGQSYDQIKEILGEGNESSSSEIAGIKTSIYNWQGKGFGSIIITIQNGEVKGKTEMGLNDNKSNITMEQYNKIENGFTYEQLKAISGEGQIISETEIMDQKSITYGYNNKNGSNANFIFTNDSMSMKSQLNLK